MEGRRVGRFVIGQELAAGGMATVHLGRMQGPAGFGKTVAIKRLHAQFAKDLEFSKMFLDEARVTSGLMHPNIVMTLDVLDEPDGLYLVMEYVHGISLANLQREIDREQKFPHRVVSAIVSNFLEGLQSAHEATDDLGAPLAIVHRDVSPQNVLVTFSGLAKIADFGIAKAAGRMHSTGDGSAKGKLSYMAPEQVNSRPVTPRTDVYAAGIVLWECLTREKLVSGTSAAERLHALLELQAAPPSSIVPGIPPALDAVVMRALEKDPEKRFASAKEMATELQRAVPPASSIEVAEWLRETVPQLVREREATLANLQKMLGRESQSGPFPTPSSSSQPLMAGPPSSQRVPATSATGETSAGNHAINDYLTQSERDALPPKMPRKILAALIMLPLLGLIGVVLVFVVMTRGKTAPRDGTANPPASASVAAAATGEPPPTTASATAVIPAPPSTNAEPTDAQPSASVAQTAAPSTAAPAKTAATAAVKPGVTTKPATTPGKKCRIVATPDKSGRMKFEEVCTP